MGVLEKIQKWSRGDSNPLPLDCQSALLKLLAKKLKGEESYPFIFSANSLTHESSDILSGYQLKTRRGKGHRSRAS